jgi:hypothetical protein
MSLVALSFLAVACAKKEPAPAPVTTQTSPPATPTPDAEPTPTPAPTPDVAPTPTPTADTPPAPTKGPSGLSPLYGPHFADDAQPLMFAWTYAVDTHDEAGSVAELSATVKCNLHPSKVGDAFIAHMNCSVIGETKGTLDIDPALNRNWVATADGLWHTTDTSPGAIADLLKTKPFLASAPVEYNKTTEGDPDKNIPGQSESVSKDGTTWCRNDSEDGMYGTVGATWCFAPDRGLVKVEMTARSGPSNEAYVRQ